jgi:hypothetical protein
MLTTAVALLRRVCTTCGVTQGALANREVAVVAAGGAHVLVMTTDGELWTWGDNSRSQLGLGRHTVRQPQPTHLQVGHLISPAEFSPGRREKRRVRQSGRECSRQRNSWLRGVWWGADDHRTGRHHGHQVCVGGGGRGTYVGGEPVG